MPRLQGVELEDLSWCPAWLRDRATDVLVFAFQLVGWPGAVARVWQPWLRELGHPRVIDCCSGACGPLGGILQEFPLRVTLTDRYPNLAAWRELARRFPEWVDFEEAPLDARCLPPDLQGVVSFFNSFHHLRPAEAEGVLREAVYRGQPIAVFEALERRWSRLPVALGVCLLAPLYALRTRPWRWERFSPLIPLLLAWDGLMSCFRIYDEHDWQNLTAAVDPEGSYHWTFGRLKLGWLPLYCPYLLGRPHDRAPRFAGLIHEA